MKIKKSLLVLTLTVAAITVNSCSWNIGKGDLRDRNLEKAVLSRLDSVPEAEYLIISDTHCLGKGKFQAVVVYNVVDSTGNKVERNARVVTNDDCSEIYTWEDLDTQVIGDAKKTFTEQMEENHLPLDGSLIDAMITLKKHTR